VTPTRTRPAQPPRDDAVLAAVFLVLSLVQVAVAPIAGPVTSVVIAVGSTLPLAWRRTYPAAAALAGTAVWAIPTSDGFLLLGYVIAGLLFYSLGAWEPRLWRTVVVSVVGIAVGVVMTLLGPEHPTAAIGAVLVVVGPVAAGRLVAHQRAQTARLRELTGLLVRERAVAERAALAEERARIARELHDVIGHEVTVIALQADAAAAALAKAPERAAAPIDAIRRSATEALAEMRRVVGMLRVAEEEDLRPQPGLVDVPALVEQSRAAGAEVALTLRPPGRPTHASVELAAYRLVQEALTNARRHSPGAPVDVRVVGDDAEVVVEVVNRRDGAIPAPRSESSGFGLVGMRERVRLLGGRLDAGPTDGGGFALTARLPLELPGTR
jgi:signal transduction histidine kinase